MNLPDQPDPSPEGLPPEDSDASAQILARLRSHGAKRSRYQVRGEIARGGMGLILRAWDEDLRRELAMKVVLGEEGKATSGIPPKVLGRFLEEAQVTGQLDHPGIVPVHELGIDEQDAVYFSMRLVRGSDLKQIFDLVASGDPEWTQTRALWVMLQVCDAMAYAHSKGVIHRDLKPANVMVGRFGEVYVMDWGLARVLGKPDRHDLRLRREDSAGFSIVQSERRSDVSHSADSVLFTMDGDVVGTPAYMAPEQARGEIERLGPRSDVYSVGAMLYHLLTGEMPFVSPGAKVSQHMVLRWNLEGPPKSVHAIRPHVPDELAAICEKAMAREPEDRYADMVALRDDLRAYLEDRVVQAYRTGAWVELRKWVRRNRRLAVAWASAVGVAVLGLGATLFVQVHERRAAEDARALAASNEERANLNLEEALKQERIAKRERSSVLRLSARQELEDLEREAERLWPAVPARTGELEAWLVRAGHLVAGLDPDPAGEDPGHRAVLAELRGRMTEPAGEERARIIAAHPDGLPLERAQRHLAALRAAAAVRAGRAMPAEVELDPETVALDPEVLNERAFALVDPARTEFGEEARGLALARAAVDLMPSGRRYLAEDTLAWAFLANGLDEEALQASQAALESSPAAEGPRFEEYLTRLAQAIQAARGPAGEAALREVEARVEGLRARVLGPRFDSLDDRWWFTTLDDLVRRIEGFADARSGLVEGSAPGRGWGVKRRLEFARTLEERTVSGPEARVLWATACAAIRDPSRAPLYAGLDLAPQLGLVPLGPDPESGLHEFADVATGTPPRRGADGRLELQPDSSLVFVLLPGGRTWMGAQAGDPLGHDFDPEALDMEGPVSEVVLDPFFLSKYEMTQGQWLRVEGHDPSGNLSGTRVAGRALTDLSPVEQVSWFEASDVLRRLGWVLPTEAQWEYAARGGEELPWWTGEDPASLQGAANLSDRFARAHGAPWPQFDDELDDQNLVHAPVGSFAPNPYGLHDILGNVFEWCRDVGGSYADPVSAGDAERRSPLEATRVVRGASFLSTSNAARSARRELAEPGLRASYIGLRPARAVTR